jgi:LuxR family maltose regulon positive regulatory protein
LLPELHRQASRWYEENDMIDSAFQHALAGQDQEKIGWILDEYTEACWRRGELTILSHRIDALTPEQLQDRQEMIIARAMILGQFGNLVEAERLLSELEQHLIQIVISMDPTEQIPGMNPVRQPRHLVGLAKAGRAHVAFLREDPQAALIFARQALDHLAKFDLPWDIPWKCQILITMGDAYFLIGDIQSGIQALEEAIPFGKAYHHHALLLEALTKQAMAYWMQGNLSQADRVCEEGHAYIANNDLSRLPISAGLWVIWGWLQTERNELEPALECLQHGLRICQGSSQPVFEYFAYAAMVRFWVAKGDLGTAEAFLRPAENLAHKRKLPFWQEAIFNGLKLLLWVKQGRLAETQQWMTLPDFRPEGEILFPYQPLFYALARLSFARGDLPAAVEILDRLLSQPVQQAHWTRLVWITRALISMRQDHVPEAIESLSMALSLAARDRCIQIFLDEGEPMALLLAEFVRQRPASGFPEQLLHAFSQKTLPPLSDEQRAIREQHVPSPSQVHSLPTKLAGGSTATQGTQNMLDPLSQRELEILSLIADGLSNQEIAARLYISVRTVKFHTSNIYCKLEAESRTEAVAIARRLKMIA